MKNLGQITDPKDIPTKEYVDSQISTAGDGKFLPLVDGGRITNSEHPSLTGTLVSSTGIAVDGDNEPHARYGTEAYFYQKSEASDAMTEISYAGVYISKGGANKELTRLHPNLLEFKSSNGVVSGLATPTTDTQAANKAYVDALGTRVSTNEDNISMAESDIESLQTDVTTLKTDNTTNQAAIKTLQDTYVPNTRKINNKSLDNDITLTASDVGAISQTSADNRYLRLTGGTLSGLLNINKTDAVDGSSNALLSLRSNKFPNSTRYTVDDKGLIKLISPATGDFYLYFNPNTNHLYMRKDADSSSGISMDYNTSTPYIEFLGTAGGRITNLATPTNNTDAANKAYVDTKATVHSYTASLSTTWTGTSAPYTQSISISGILSTDKPHITPVYSTTNATAILEKKAWNCVSKAVTSAGKITFTCFEEKPTQALSLQIEVIR